MSFIADHLHALRASTVAPASTAHMPGVGWLVGVVACASFALIGLVLPAIGFGGLAAAAGSTMATVLLTGGVNERGLSRDADRSLQLGTLMLLLVVSAKLALLATLAAISPSAVLAALLGAHVLSRFWPLVLGARMSNRAIGIAAAWCIAALAVCVLARGLVFAVLALLASAGAWWVMRRRAARHDDPEAAAGATQQWCELAFYLGAAIGADAR